ncbi:glucosaminidase domain-containing protein [Crocinitomicaceae bacterium]|nr:glucosaminidase domain-containing protein [Crocinitomicaceae bacterium]
MRFTIHTTNIMTRFAAIFLISAFPSLLWAHNFSARKAYIDEYSYIAVSQMHIHKIPASITLAQGILESGSGNSFLARSSNNHFGIKCGSQWKGKTSYHDDDKKNECFRSYSRVKDSYLDHSLFLTTNKRYAFLFNLSIEDYKSWAHGLSKAGYATNSKYAERLIQLIEDEQLYTYDRENELPEVAFNGSHETHPKAYSINKLNVIASQKNDTFFKISQRTGLTLRQLHKYNAVINNCESLQVDSPIYLQRKKNRSSKAYIILKSSTTLAHLSQIEGVRIKALMKFNQISTPNQLLQKGEKIFLR